MYAFGIIMGALLLVAKYGGFWLITSKKVEYPLNSNKGKITYNDEGKATHREKYEQRTVGEALIWIPVLGWILIPFTSDITKRKGVRDTINNKPFLLFLTDALFGYLGMHVLAIMGGSIIAGIAMVTYTVTCMCMIFTKIMFGSTKPRKKRVPARYPSYQGGFR